MIPNLYFVLPNSNSFGYRKKFRFIRLVADLVYVTAVAYDVRKVHLKPDRC